MENPAETPLAQGVQQTQQPAPPVQQIQPEEVLLTWESANRPFKKRDREYYTTIAVIVFLLSIILFFAGQFLLIAVIVSFAFVSYALAAVPPENTKHIITTYGIRMGEKLYTWDMLGRFWFSTALGQRVLHVEYYHRFIGNLSLVLSDVKEEDVKSALEKYLVFERPVQTFAERGAQWLQQKFPLDKA
ncbi:MAG TPA: hypothetical protein DCX25_02280 [Candidatus Pacebacteria bacterium]|nr:MAG: hypothetical protein UX00_C0007G0136 [Microgenomates group bacterium GW2011_GWB1_45_17]KKU23337.1 MAG: hypothetical protein UX35_C0006G0013 [Microgenomates group bacterium GW2011_GWA1_46_15]KKU24534.1 MAG: hypothetical protein UX36_C0001G0151 [Microgenomates group bacterium GW2011_GWC1_46_15]HAV15130.1 hypothetical protein [Candidatus Paceibacterota bacterium]HCR11042.1 hypothetical protein [Candidatus Paceibacterota bacterium]